VSILAAYSFRPKNLSIFSGAVSEVKKHVTNLEATLVHAAVASTSDNSVMNGDSISNSAIFANDQEDLLDLAWSEKNCENGSSAQVLQSAHLDLLREEFAADLEDTLETRSMSRNYSTSSESRTSDTFQDSIDQPASQPFNEKEQFEYEVEPESPRKASLLSKTAPVRASTLVQAVVRGDLEDVTDLLDNGYDIETVEPENRRTGLMYAAILNHSEILQLLLDRGVNIPARDRAKRTALHFAASEGSCMSNISTRIIPGFNDEELTLSRPMR
jgi:ankyrin repeat protein